MTSFPSAHSSSSKLPSNAGCGDAGADLVTCHVEADTPEKIHLALDKIHAKGKKSGVVLKPNTRAEAVLPFLDKCDIVLVMTVEPGFGGHIIQIWTVFLTL